MQRFNPSKENHQGKKDVFQLINQENFGKKISKACLNCPNENNDFTDEDQFIEAKNGNLIDREGIRSFGLRITGNELKQPRF